MKRVSYYKGNRTGNVLHIETEGAVVNIRVGLQNTEGQEVTSIEILPDNLGAKPSWIMPDEIGKIDLPCPATRSGEHMKALNVRVIKKAA